MTQQDHAHLMTQAEYARHRKARGLPGRTQESVRQAVEQGQIGVFGPKKLIEPALADQQWARNRRVKVDTALEAKKSLRAVESGGKPPESAKNGILPVSPPTLEVPISGYAAARARREEADAEHAELELRRKKGELVARVDIERGVFEVARELRDTLEASINQLAPEVASLTSAEACADAIRQHNRAVCDVLVRKWREKVGPLPAGGLG